MAVILNVLSFLATLNWPTFAILLTLVCLVVIVYNRNLPRKSSASFSTQLSTPTSTSTSTATAPEIPTWSTRTTPTRRIKGRAHKKPNNHAKVLVPKSVNFHFTRECNYACGFCFHTAKDTHLLPIEKQFQGLKMLADAGMEKINFSGGEPFLKDRGHRVGKLVQYCKQTLKLSSVSIVTNGSLVTEKWFEDYGANLDILAVSCDSFDQQVNIKIGRHHRHKDHLKSLQQVRDWCGIHKVLFKLNTVVNAYNWDEDMSESLEALRPICRWKIFKVLPIEGENSTTTPVHSTTTPVHSTTTPTQSTTTPAHSTTTAVITGARVSNVDVETSVTSTSTTSEALRDVTPFLIPDDKYEAFLQRHRDGGLSDIMVPENNETMQNSYLILDERMRFLDCTSGAKTPSPSILDVDVDTALRSSGFDEDMFVQRKGEYAWTKPCASDPNMEW